MSTIIILFQMKSYVCFKINIYFTGMPVCVYELKFMKYVLVTDCKAMTHCTDLKNFWGE